MSNLISGKEALIALANGEDVESRHRVIDTVWGNAKCLLLIESFLDPDTLIDFRLKPKTIKINGIEVPAPFEPKDGDEFWILFESHYSPCGYKLVLPDDRYSELCYGAWRTEDEIKQVVAALRSIFKTNTTN